MILKQGSSQGYSALVADSHSRHSRVTNQDKFQEENRRHSYFKGEGYRYNKRVTTENELFSNAKEFRWEFQFLLSMETESLGRNWVKPIAREWEIVFSSNDMERGQEYRDNKLISQTWLNPMANLRLKWNAEMSQKFRRFMRKKDPKWWLGITGLLMRRQTDKSEW